MAELTGRKALVTGSTRGIGLAVARALARAGAAVVVSARTAAEVDAVARRLGEEVAGPVLGIPCDVRDPAACRRLVEGAAEGLGGLDLLVNNAGSGLFRSIDELTVEEFRLQLETNLAGPFYCAKAALPWLEASDDAWIVHVGSLAGRNAFAGGTGYNASKFGLVGLSEAMMLDLRHRGIRVSLVMPGSVNTGFRGKEASEERSWPLEADDVAQAVLDLLAFHPGALVSRIEMRPSRPPKG